MERERISCGFLAHSVESTDTNQAKRSQQATCHSHSSLQVSAGLCLPATAKGKVKKSIRHQRRVEARDRNEYAAATRTLGGSEGTKYHSYHTVGKRGVRRLSGAVLCM